MNRVQLATSLALLALVSACESKTTTPSHHGAPSEVTHPILEGDLPAVRLSAEATSRLRIETTTVRAGPVPRIRLAGGDVEGEVEGVS